MTPFDDHDRLDEHALRAHLRRLGASGIGVYLAGAGSGEGYALRADECRRILTIGAEELQGVVPVRAMGVEPRTAREMIEFSEVVAASGLEAMQVYSLDGGHGNAPNPDEMHAYYTDVLDEISMPVILSTHYSVGYFIPVELIDELLRRYDNIVGINCTTPDWTYLVRTIDMVAGRAEIHVGGPMQSLGALALGATGYLSSVANIAPRLCVSVTDRWDAGDEAGAAEAYAKVMRLFTMNMSFTAIVGVKAALNLLGLPGGSPRRPRLPAPAAQVAMLAEVLDELEIRDIEGLDRPFAG